MSGFWLTLTAIAEAIVGWFAWNERKKANEAETRRQQRNRWRDGAR